MARRRVALVGGGTAGHVSPALAIADTYRNTFPDVDILFLGTAEGMEGRLIPPLGHRLELIPGAPLFGAGAGDKVRAFRSLGSGIVEARRRLQAHGSRLVIGLGGYASAGAVLAGRSLRLGTVIHESNAVPGLANRMLGPFVDCVYLGFEDARRRLSARRIQVTGIPVRAEIAAGRGLARALPAAGDPLHLLVLGGSQGAPFLNSAVPDLARWLLSAGLRLQLHHQAGDFDPQPVRAAYARAGIDAVVEPYIADMASAYGDAHFAITRSGAATLAELAASGLPSLVVPLPNCAADHQTANAIAFAATGGGQWVAESRWDPVDLAGRIASLLRDRTAWDAASQAARRFDTPDSAERVVAACEALMRGRW